jgi:hypothetical protein
VPDASVALMSEWFADDHARILTDHDAVTGEVVHLLHRGAAEAQH